MSSLIPMFLVMLLAHVRKGSNSHSHMFSKKSVFKNFAIFTIKKLCWNLFLITFQDYKSYIFIQKETPTLVFFCEYCEIFKNNFFIEDLLIIPFPDFYLMIDIWFFRVIFYYLKLGHATEKTSQQIDQNLFFAI